MRVGKKAPSAVAGHLAVNGKKCEQVVVVGATDKPSPAFWRRLVRVFSGTIPKDTDKERRAKSRSAFLVRGTRLINVRCHSGKTEYTEIRGTRHLGYDQRFSTHRGLLIYKNIFLNRDESK